MNSTFAKVLPGGKTLERAKRERRRPSSVLEEGFNFRLIRLYTSLGKTTPALPTEYDSAGTPQFEKARWK